MEPPRRLTVFAGSAAGTSPDYARAATRLGDCLARAGIGVVYGGASVGVMGALADAALRAGGEVIGVIPQSLVDHEIAHPGLTRLDVVADMHARKQRMTELADGFVALPGGAGTLDELFEVWTWQQLGYHDKPVAFLDVAGYWRPLLDALEGMAAAGFVRRGPLDALVVESEPEAMLARLREWPGA